MPVKAFPVVAYDLILARENTLGGTIKFYATIVCTGVEGDRLAIYFLRPDSAPAKNVYTPSAKWATSFVPAEQYPWYVDILRNENPVYAYVDSDNPNVNALKTNLEAVGEGEV